jgi:hypothetical protein
MALRYLDVGFRILAFGVLFAAAYLFFFWAIYPDWHRFERLSKVGIQTRGHVIAKEPLNHNGIRYEYRVGDTSYTGISTAGHGGLRPFESVRVGDQIVVTYLPESPGVSTAGDPKEHYASRSGLLFVIMPLAIAAVLLMGFLIHRRLRKGDSGQICGG